MYVPISVQSGIHVPDIYDLVCLLKFRTFNIKRIQSKFLPMLFKKTDSLRLDS